VRVAGAPRTWRGVTRGRSSALWAMRLRRWVRTNFGQPLLVAIQDFNDGRTDQAQYDQIKNSLPFTLQRAMTACGMDFYLRNDYSKAWSFFAQERSTLETALHLFVTSQRYADLVRAGATDNVLFYEFMISALQNDVYPLFADRDDGNRYKVLERPDYLYLLQLRTKSIASEVNRRSSELVALDPHFALSGALQRPALRDGTMFQLPPPSQRECPYGCGQLFPDNTSLAQHINANHVSTPPVP